MSVRIRVRVEPDGDGWIVRSPAVGRWLHLPAEGSWMGPGDPVGELEQLNLREILVLPKDVGGVLRRRATRNRELDVGYGDVLFRLERLGDSIGADAATAGEAAVEGHLVPAPTDGVFYSKASPDSPPFVAVGDTIEHGHPIGLVEVMKTFNQIHYDEEGDLPQRAEVLEVLVEDGQEINAGQPLLRVR